MASPSTMSIKLVRHHSGPVSSTSPCSAPARGTKPSRRRRREIAELPILAVSTRSKVLLTFFTYFFAAVLRRVHSLVLNSNSEQWVGRTGGPLQRGEKRGGGRRGSRRNGKSGGGCGSRPEGANLRQLGRQLAGEVQRHEALQSPDGGAADEDKR